MNTFPEVLDLATEPTVVLNEAGALATEEHRGPDGKELPDLAASEFAGDSHTREDTEEHGERADSGFFELSAPVAEWEEEERQRWIYRARTVAMLRRYNQYSLDTGRVPSILGREFFRSLVTSYSVVTFEDRVIFVHDMETCLGRLDEFSRQLIARHILQEHDRFATAKLLRCNEKTVRRLTPLALDQLAAILLDLGLMEKPESKCKKCCQGGLEDEILVSSCEEDK